MQIVHLMASPFLGGPERQVLGLSRALSDYRTTFLSFAESGKARPLLDQARADGFEAIELKTNFPRLDRAVSEVADHLRTLRADVLCTSGYKPDLVGWRAARRVGIPVVPIAHGWTGATLKVRAYECIDAVSMCFANAVVCVSEAVAWRVRRAGIPANRCVVIRNALDTTPYDHPCPEARHNVEALFTESSVVPRLIVGAVGRLSPEKGFDVLIDAAAQLSREAGVGFVLFGDGPKKQELQRRIADRGLVGRFVLAGFRPDLDRFLPGLDLAASSSFTEGLPVAVLECMAAGLPIVATAVGGTPEVVADRLTGHLVPPGNPSALASGIRELLHDSDKRHKMGYMGADRVRSEFTFAAQAERYQRLFERLVRTEAKSSLAQRCCHAR